MSMPKGKHQGGQTQGFPQRYPHTSFVSRSTTPQQRPDVSFHVAATPFPPQQGGGAVPPGGPQLRGIHHPHHGANPPIPQTHQQQPPPSQSQHSGGPPGPAPTSTPPGPADMGKQGPPHLQGQPQMPQGGQMQLSFGVTNQTRPNTSQPYFGGPRGPTPRMPNHRGQVVNMSTNNVGQQIFSSHVPIQQMSMYPGVVPAPINPNQMFVPSQMQMFSAQSRHQGAGTNYFPPPAGQQQLMMHQQHQLYQGFQTGQAQFYFSGVRSAASMAGAPAGVGPGLTGGASQPVVVPGAPPQMGQTGQVSMMPIAGSNVMGVPGLAGESGTSSGPVSSSSNTGNKNARRKYALDIIDPKTMKNVEIYESSRSSTPPRSGDSSARETPQPSSTSGPLDVAAEFAARVAKVASEKSSGPSASQVQFPEQSGPGTQSVNVNGPDQVSTNSVVPSSEGVLNQSETSTNKPLIGSLDESMTSWKQTQPKASSIGTKINSSKNSKMESSKVDDHGHIGLETDNLVKQELDRERSVPLGVPSVSAKDGVTISQSEIPVSIVSQSINPVSLVPVKDHSTGVLAVDPNLTPVVSAITNSPDVEVVHHRPGNRERDQHPGLKSSTQTHPSPIRRKPQRPPESNTIEKVTSSHSAPVVTTIPNITTITQVSSASGIVVSSGIDLKPLRENTPANTETKLSSSLPSVAKKTSSASEQTSQVLEEPMFVTPAPKERKEDKSRGRDRSSHRKESSDKAREKSQGRERDKIQSSRTRENSTPGPAVANVPLLVSPTESSMRAPAKSSIQSAVEESVSKHQANGEAIDMTEGKANQRSKHKRGQQKKEINRKGAEKEGTEMDAFAEAASSPTIIDNAASSTNQPVTSVPPVPASYPVPVHAASPTPPPPTTVPAVTAASSTTPSTLVTNSNYVVSSDPVVGTLAVAPSAPVSSIPTSNISQSASSVSNPIMSGINKMAGNTDLKNENVDINKEEKEEKLVAARNEENAKVSAALLEKSALIEQSTPGKSVSAPKHAYKEDQWSPNNQDGKKKYERDFLLSLKNEPLSKQKPSNLPDIEIVLKDPRPQRAMDLRGPHDAFTPKFMNTQGPSSRGGVPPKRGSQQGKTKGGKPQGVIHLTLSLKEEVKLRETENAWKPGRMKQPETTTEEEDAKTEDLYKKVRGVLNKLTPQKFNTLVEQVRSLPIDTKDKLQGVINLVFDKAIDEPGFSVAYAMMCKVLSDIEVPYDKDEIRREEIQDVQRSQNTQHVNFRKLIVNRCQHEFEKNTQAELNKEQRLREISDTKDSEKKKELQVQFDEESRKLRMKSVGNIRFIGELFKLQMLTTNIMHRCIRQLLSDGDEESLECLCKLLTTIGRDLESKKQDLSPYFEKMKQISNKKGDISSRVRFMLQDVIELRENKWVPRRDDVNPKTIDQINKEAEKEAVEKEVMNSGPASGSRYKNEDRGGDRKKNRGATEDGWSLAGRSNKNYTVDTMRLKPKVVENDSLTLGCRSNFTNWNANSKAADVNKKGASPVYSNNSFAALSEMSSEEKRGSSLSSSARGGGNKIAPSPSLEKERMLAGLKSATEGIFLTELRPQHSHIQQSRSSSRDNAPRGGGDDDHRGQNVSNRLGPNSASNDDLLRGTSPDTSPMPSGVSVMPEVELKKETILLLDEYFNSLNEVVIGQAIQQTFGEANIHAFVVECINGVLEKSSPARHNVAKLMCHLMKENILAKQIFFSSLMDIIDDGEDLVIDIPKIWLYVAEYIVPSLSKEVISFSEFRSNIANENGKLVGEVLQLLVKDKGPAWIKEKWDSSGVTLTDFISHDKIESFVKQYNLESTVGSGVSSLAPSSLSMEEVQKKLVQFLKSEQGAAHSFDQICDWIGANVGDRISDPLFIRALMTALCESAVSQSPNSIKLKEEVLTQHTKFFQKYIGNKEENELQCLHAVQAFDHKLEHPQGLICSIFHFLWENNFISTESFILWEDRNDPSPQAGKGVALKALTSFFTALREGEDESEES